MKIERVLRTRDVIPALVSRGRGTWIYRGVDRSSHDLVPASLRPQTHSRLTEIFPSSSVIEFDGRSFGDGDEARQVVLEMRLLSDFANAVADQGLLLPAHMEELRFAGNANDGTIDISVLATFDAMLPDSFIALGALAQHYGIPTRLLDWSRSPLVAAFFAASGASKRLETLRESVPDPSELTKADLDNEDFSIWALDVSKGIEFESESDDELRIVAPFYANNPHLEAQQGLFTMVRRPMSNAFWTSRVERRCLSARVPPDQITRIDIPLDCCNGLLDELRKFSVDRHTIFPGLSTAAEHAVRRRETTDEMLQNAQYSIALKTLRPT